eukprot:746864-Hanusia_phi.AAC.5
MAKSGGTGSPYVACSYKTFEQCTERLRGFFLQLAPADVEKLEERLGTKPPDPKANDTNKSDKCMSFEFAAASLLDALNPEASAVPTPHEANAADVTIPAAGESMCARDEEEDSCCDVHPDSCEGCVGEESSILLSCCSEEAGLKRSLLVERPMKYKSLKDLTTSDSFFCMDAESVASFVAGNGRKNLLQGGASGDCASTWYPDDGVVLAQVHCKYCSAAVGVHVLAATRENVEMIGKVLIPTERLYERVGAGARAGAGAGVSSNAMPRCYSTESGTSTISLSAGNPKSCGLLSFFTSKCQDRSGSAFEGGRSSEMRERCARTEEKENVIMIDCDVVGPAGARQGGIKSNRHLSRAFDAGDAFEDEDDDFRPSRPTGAALKRKKKLRT